MLSMLAGMMGSMDPADIARMLVSQLDEPQKIEAFRQGLRKTNFDPHTRATLAKLAAICLEELQGGNHEGKTTGAGTLHRAAPPL